MTRPMRFLGKFSFRLDPKGRINIPARFREELPSKNDGKDRSLVVIKGLDGCAWIYPIATFDALMNYFDSPELIANPMVRHFQTLFTDGASVETPDEQGRVSLSDEIRAHAGLDGEVEIHGCINRIEVWSPDARARHIAKVTAQGKDLEALASEFFAAAIAQKRQPEAA
jgi:MraZ protein